MVRRPVSSRSSSLTTAALMATLRRIASVVGSGSRRRTASACFSKKASRPASRIRACLIASAQPESSRCGSVRRVETSARTKRGWEKAGGGGGGAAPPPPLDQPVVDGGGRLQRLARLAGRHGVGGDGDAGDLQRGLRRHAVAGEDVFVADQVSLRR